MKKPLIMIAAISLLVLIAAGAYLAATANKNTSQAPPPTDGEVVYCPQDAKICPDGSYVGRTPPSCEFAKCPGEETSSNPNATTD